MLSGAGIKAGCGIIRIIAGAVEEYPDGQGNFPLLPFLFGRLRVLLWFYCLFLCTLSILRWLRCLSAIHQQ
ncbi:hypothetical protein RDT67_01280 [Serratia fonticola]|uniref:Uncharacterized protein n=1 Tax=Serratia fonticola TaxID=47917 RepID=A0AAJ1Y7D5_SERFO|nr:hypothetical protein [Serratia fonticola]MDQ9125053.1 hypothetical protein [Serratia fonticola]